MLTLEQDVRVVRNNRAFTEDIADTRMLREDLQHPVGFGRGWSYYDDTAGHLRFVRLLRQDPDALSSVYDDVQQNVMRSQAVSFLR